MTLRVRVQPRASPQGLVGTRAGTLLVRLGASPVRGAANRALLDLLGRELGVSPSTISIVRGETTRDKLLRIQGASAETIRARLRSRLGESLA